MEATARRKYIRSSARKMRRVVNAVRGERVAKAFEVLNFLPQAATRPVELAIRSAVHNLMDRYREERIAEEELVITDIRVDEGPVFRRFRAAPRGRSRPYKKRLSHLTVVVAVPENVQEDL